LDDAELVGRYLDGESELALSKAFEVNRWTVRKRLVAAGVQPRGRSDAMSLRWDRSDEATREAHAETMRRRMTGRRRKLDTKLRAAASKKQMVGEGEKIIAAELQRLGIAFEAQAPIHVYNIDLLVGDIALEPRTRSENPMKHAGRSKRTAYLMARGIVTIWILHTNTSVLRECLPNIVSELRTMQALPTSKRKPLVVHCRQMPRRNGPPVSRYYHVGQPRRSSSKGSDQHLQLG